MPARSKFTPETRSLILSALRFGVSHETAAWSSGINPSQLSRWLKRGETRGAAGVFRDFYEQVKRVEAEPRLRLAEAAFRAATENGELAWKMGQRLEPAFRPIETAPRPIGPIVVRLELPSMPLRPSSEVHQLPAG